MKKVLLVEDEVQVASFINKGLTEEGFDVSVAFDGNVGWECFNKEVLTSLSWILCCQEKMAWRFVLSFGK